MIWGLFTVLIMAALLLFSAPFLDFLRPDDTIWLLDTSDADNPLLLAQGAETLWFHWQSWGYIFLFCLVTTLILGIVFNVIRTFSDESLDEAKQRLSQKTEELERLQREYKNRVTQEVQREHREESERLRKRAHELSDMRAQIERKRQESEKNLKMANYAEKRQHQETQSKLGQRDRLSEQKKLIVDYLQNSNWQWPDGTQVTYQSLLKEAKKGR